MSEQRSQELYQMLAEKCSEVAKTCARILRFGADSHDMDEQSSSNRDILERELSDALAVVTRLRQTNEIALSTLESDLEARFVERLLVWTRHQRGAPPQPGDELRLDSLGVVCTVESVSEDGTVVGVSDDNLRVVLKLRPELFAR